MSDYGYYERSFEQDSIEKSEAQYTIINKKLQQIKEQLANADFTQCQRCDGVGLPDCGDTDCATYILHKIREVVEQ